MRLKQSGFTLLELMVTVVIIGILSSIAIPSYLGMLASSRRQDGFSDLYTIMGQQERFFLNNLRYTTTLGNGGLGYVTNADGSVTSPEENYRTTAAVCNDTNGNPLANVNNCIRLIATAQNPDDPDFWLQSDGQKSSLTP